jgi:hypothetical protein
MAAVCLTSTLAQILGLLTEQVGGFNLKAGVSMSVLIVLV